MSTHTVQEARRKDNGPSMQMEARTRLILPSAIYDEMISHCIQGCPNEVCGILAGRGTEISKIYRMNNVERSPISYLMDTREQFNVMKDLRSNNLSMVALYHSHPASEAFPSSKDMQLAFYEETAYIIVGLLTKKATVRAFFIRAGTIEEIGIIIQ